MIVRRSISRTFKEMMRTRAMRARVSSEGVSVRRDWRVEEESRRRG